MKQVYTLLSYLTITSVRSWRRIISININSITFPPLSGLVLPVSRQWYGLGNDAVQPEFVVSLHLPGELFKRGNTQQTAIPTINNETNNISNFNDDMLIAYCKVN